MNTKDPRSFNEPERKTLDASDIQGLGDAVLVLARELWVLTDRLVIMEAVLAKRGIDLSKEIDAFQPDADMQTALNERGAKLIQDLTNAIAGAESQSPK